MFDVSMGCWKVWEVIKTWWIELGMNECIHMNG